MRLKVEWVHFEVNNIVWQKGGIFVFHKGAV
jgi:hypothetical protein